MQKKKSLKFNNSKPISLCVVHPGRLPLSVPPSHHLSHRLSHIPPSVPLSVRMAELSQSHLVDVRRLEERWTKAERSLQSVSQGVVKLVSVGQTLVGLEGVALEGGCGSAVSVCPLPSVQSPRQQQVSVCLSRRRPPSGSLLPAVCPLSH